MSDLGRLSYEAYWKSVVLEYLNKHISCLNEEKTTLSIKKISVDTGICPHDIAYVLQMLKLIKMDTYVNKKDGQQMQKFVIMINMKHLNEYLTRTEKSRATRIKLDEECLIWTPYISYHLITNEEMQTEKEVKDLGQSLNAYSKELKTNAKERLNNDDNNENLNNKLHKRGRKRKSVLPISTDEESSNILDIEMVAKNEDDKSEVKEDTETKGINH